MSLPQVSTAALVKAFFRLGFIERDRKSSHIKIYHPTNPSRFAAIPNHKGQNVSIGSLRNILKSTKVDIEQLKKVI